MRDERREKREERREKRESEREIRGIRRAGAAAAAAVAKLRGGRRSSIRIQSHEATVPVQLKENSPVPGWS